eukprot:4909908-Pleurochrysis_carterae.AAC.1
MEEKWGIHSRKGGMESRMERSVTRIAHKSTTRATQLERGGLQEECRISGAIRTDSMRCAIREAKANRICAIQPVPNDLTPPCRNRSDKMESFAKELRVEDPLNHETNDLIERTGTRGKRYKDEHRMPEPHGIMFGILKNDEHTQGTKGINSHVAETLANAWISICGIAVTWLMRTTKGCAGPEQGKRTKNRGGAKVSKRAKRAIQLRRLVHQRIRRWNKTRKVKYHDKERRKYRHKVRASLRWMQRKGSAEQAKEANIREGRNRVKKTREKIMKRKGGAGGRGKAKTVEFSNVEEELMKDIGVPKYTWGDGSCWLWAVAGALQKLEGKEAPTENDIQLEKEWRAAIKDTIITHGIPITDDELRGLREGVQYTHGKLKRGGAWGGGTEHQALAMILKVNIVIWDRRYIGKVGAQHKQLYICTPQGSTYLRSVAHTKERQVSFAHA